MSTQILEHTISQIALTLFARKGYDNILFADIAREAGLDEEELAKHYSSKQDIVLSLYQNICREWEEQLQDLGSTKLHERFEEATIRKIGLIAPYADVLRDIISLLLRNSALVETSERARQIRAHELRLIREVAAGATDSSTLKKKVENLPSLLYLIHWAALFLYLQNNDLEKISTTISLFGRLIRKTGSVSFLFPLFPFLKELTDWADSLLEEETNSVLAK